MRAEFVVGAAGGLAAGAAAAMVAPSNEIAIVFAPVVAVGVPVVAKVIQAGKDLYVRTQRQAKILGNLPAPPNNGDFRVAGDSIVYSQGSSGKNVRDRIEQIMHSDDPIPGESQTVTNVTHPQGRSAVLKTSSPQDADAWAKALRGAGFRDEHSEQ